MIRIRKEYYPEIIFVLFLIVMFAKVYILIQLANSEYIFG